MKRSRRGVEAEWQHSLSKSPDDQDLHPNKFHGERNDTRKKCQIRGEKRHVAVEKEDSHNEPNEDTQKKHDEAPGKDTKNDLVNRSITLHHPREKGDIDNFRKKKKKRGS